MHQSSMVGPKECAQTERRKYIGKIRTLTANKGNDKGRDKNHSRVPVPNFSLCYVGRYGRVTLLIGLRAMLQLHRRRYTAQS